MIGRLLCAVGLHEWWPRATWPNELATGIVLKKPLATLNLCTAVCGRCPAKRYARLAP